MLVINLTMRVSFRRTENRISSIANLKERHSEPCKPQEAEEANGGFEGARAGDFLDFAKDVVGGSKEQIVEDFEQRRFIVLAGKVSSSNSSQRESWAGAWQPTLYLLVEAGE